jgi:hypothetical protein
MDTFIATRLAKEVSKVKNPAMKNLIVFALALLALAACEEEKLNDECSAATPATIRDFNELDGCGWVFELEDGTILQPIMLMPFCGTPPLPKEVTENPLYNYPFEDGKRVLINYVSADFVTACMAGETVNIRCIEDAPQASVQEN